MHALNFNIAQASVPRIDTYHRVYELAHAALKHIPGGTQAVERQFNMDNIKPELKEPQPVNLVMHHVPHR